MTEREQGIGSPQNLSEKGRAAKPSRIPDETIAFLKRATEYGATTRIAERQRSIIDLVKDNSGFTLQELAEQTGISVLGVSKLLRVSIKRTWEETPEFVREDFPPLEELLRRRKRGVSLGKHTPEHNANSGAGLRRRQERRKEETPEWFTSLAELPQVSFEEKKQYSPERRANISKGVRRHNELRKQQQASGVVFDANSPQQ